ncbi:UDP-N-acetylglucosamine 1-carboxyvinyltransferase [Kineothrix sedimenti]|uniref:UDP-N-acetylglucosamine 1-carboxyvinyltransferase n=1 Tax=Kineothrix sedimenti TaxID=3123317 RepID=A0ABZ3ER49_9FIRM
MDSIHMYGGNFLRGEVKIQGSKNAVLPIMAASLLIKGTCVIENCPRIADVYLMQNLLQELGCLVTWSENTVTINASHVIDNAMSGESVRSMRSSVMLLGAMLGRIGEVFMAYPGGCVIGKRPIDLHLAALKEMGVEITEQEHFFTAKVSRLKAMDYTLPFPSVGATENIILAAVLAEGTTTVRGAAKEPEITALCEFLKAAGADIEGAGKQTVVIKGVKELGEARYTVPGDRIVAGTYLIAALAVGGNIFLEKAPAEHMTALLKTAVQMGGNVTIKESGVGAVAIRRLEAVPYLKTEVYDGFPTDLQSPIMAAMAVARGDSVLEETIFENRFRIVDELRRMGADIRTEKNKAYISGIERLKGAVVEAEELRGGAALIVAGLEAEGETVIKNRHFIERGYEDICRDLRNLGADINIG